jgi:hypothetical protein
MVKQKVIIICFCLSGLIFGCSKNIPVPNSSEPDMLWLDGYVAELAAEKEQEAGNREKALAHYESASENYKKASDGFNSILQDVAYKKNISNLSAMGDNFLHTNAEALAQVGAQYQNRAQQKQLAQISALKSASSNGTGYSGYARALANKKKLANKNVAYSKRQEYKSIPDPQTVSIGEKEKAYAQKAIKTNKSIARVEKIITCYKKIMKNDQLQTCLNDIKQKNASNIQ